MLTLAKMTDKKWKEIAPLLPRRLAPDEVAALFAKLGDSSVRVAGKGWAAIVRGKDEMSELYVMPAGAKDPQRADVPAARALQLHDVSLDGKSVVVSATEHVYEVELASGKSHVVFRLPDGAWALSIVYLAGGRAAITFGQTLLFLETAEAWRQISSPSIDGEHHLTAVRAGSILITTPSGNYAVRRPIAYSVSSDSLDEIGRASDYFKAGAEELDGRVFVTDSKWKRHELLGLPGICSKLEVGADDYIFYGESPSDWYEGANLGHPYELVFRQPPNDALKAKIARLIEQKTSKGPVEVAPTPWMWSGRFALFFVGERNAHGDRFFEAMRALLDLVHAQAQLAEVIFRGTRGDNTTYPRPPTPGPRYPKSEFPRMFGSTIDDSLPIGAPDQAFENARREKKKSS